MKTLLLAMLVAWMLPAYAHDDNPRGGSHKPQPILRAPYTVQLQPGLGADDGSLIDIMVVFSNQAVAYGWDLQISAQNAVDQTNAIWANSGISARLRLVAAQGVNYNETNVGADVFTNAINFIVSDAGVAALRNQAAADLVSMFVVDATYCGLGYIGPNPNYAHTVVNLQYCSNSSYYTLAHEVGHNFGALHDPYVDPSTYPYPYGHGYLSPQASARDVMSYPNGCGSCTRIPYYSNPLQSYGGFPFGDPAVSDVARVMNQNAYTVANFRTLTAPPPPPPPVCKPRGRKHPC